ncbi:hypothetical protein OIU78_007990 [Salix suchowensis]|nr:hypothetical protein OIU78_007990 [Salix suchowensis]
MSVQEYLDKHMLSRKIEDAVNAAVRAKTSDPVLFISNHMRKIGPAAFRASVPSGHVSGMYEAVELRDGDKGIYLGNSVTRAIKNINEKISEALVGMDPTLQSQIDQAMIDLNKTEKKGELGANAMLAVSIAACKAGAAEREVPLYKHISDLFGKTNPTLPVPAFTVISGGKHAGNNLAIQEIMILPIGANRFEEALQMGSETYHHLKMPLSLPKYVLCDCHFIIWWNRYEVLDHLDSIPVVLAAVIKEKYGEQGCNVGEDGGFSPNLSSVQEGLGLVKEAISRTGYGERIKMAIDVAATTFCKGTKYDLDYKSQNKSGQNFKSADDMINMYKELCAEYPIVSIEDPFDREDWEHIKQFSELGLCQVVGDDFLMSNYNRTKRAINESSCTALLLKVNQIGTVTEALEVVKLAKDAHWGVVASHRIGETEDSFIADLSVGLAMGQIKTGAPCRGERVAKYNQLLRIEEELGDQAVYAGEDWRAT